MNKPCRLLTGVALAAFLPRAYPAQAQLLTPTSAPMQDWVSVAVSGDGARLAAVGSYGWLYLSTNSGVNWTPAVTSPSGSEPYRPWTGVASSADGNELVAVCNFLPIFCSMNAGESWNQRGPATLWSSATVSANGTVMAAADNNEGSIYISRDHGATWVASGAPHRRWRSIVSSGDGGTLFAGADTGTSLVEVAGIYVSTNSGVTWTITSAPPSPWQALALSADGGKVAAGSYGGPVYLSADSGGHWSSTPLPNLHWGGLASSADGVHLVAVASEGVIYTSNDSGRTWTKASAPAASWQTVACSSDGLKLFAGAWNDPTGGIYAAQLAPKLSIFASQSGPVISWPNSAEGFSLEQSPDILTRNWQPVAIAPTVVSGQNQVAITLIGGTSAYRLVRRQQ